MEGERGDRRCRTGFSGICTEEGPAYSTRALGRPVGALEGFGVVVWVGQTVGDEMESVGYVFGLGKRGNGEDQVSFEPVYTFCRIFRLTFR